MLLLCASAERNEWPMQTAEPCHWCLRTITCQPPWPLPVAYDQRTHQYRCLGFFCSANCAEAQRRALRVGDQQFLRLIARDYYGAVGRIVIVPAPPREYLAVLYGRHRDWEAAYNEFHSADLQVSRYPAPGLFVRATYFLEKTAVAEPGRSAPAPTALDDSKRGCLEQQKRVLKRKPASAAPSEAFDLRSIFGGKAQ
jgi:hypothetical protein